MVHFELASMTKEGPLKSKEFIRDRGEELDSLYLEQGRIQAQYYAQMRISNATLELRRATEELEYIYKNWEKMEKDAPIYWDMISEPDGTLEHRLVGEVARDYEQPPDYSGKTEYTLPNGQKVIE